LLKKLKSIWRLISKPPTILWLYILYGAVAATSNLVNISKKIHIKASQASTRVEKRLKNWDKDPDWQLKTPGKLVTNIDPRNIEPCAEEVHIGPSLEVLCTYEWKYTPLEARNPTIYVPGFARRFNKPPLPCKVEQDSGEVWKDQHISRVFNFQFEPLFQALSAMNPDVRFHEVDIVVRSSILLLLLDVAQGKNKQTFILELKMVGKTLFIHSKGSGKVVATKESYGRNFEDQFTQPTGELDADGYHRVLRYTLGPLILVVRLETDAFLDGVEVSADTTFHGYKSFDPSSQHSGISHPYATSLVLGGCLVPQSVVTELKTTNAGVGAIVAKSLPQLWAGQYNTIVVGDRKSGEVDPNSNLSRKQKKAAAEKLALEKKEGEDHGFAMFYSADVKDIRQDRNDWEDDNQSGLRKLASLLKEMMGAVGKAKGGKVFLRKVDRTGPLELYEGGEDMTDALPKEIVDIFWN
jgi:hypothetical protein